MHRRLSWSQALAAADDDTPLPELLDGVLTGVRRDCGALLAMPEKHETMQVSPETFLVHRTCTGRFVVFFDDAYGQN
jgi:hypothetical protein